MSSVALAAVALGSAIITICVLYIASSSPSWHAMVDSLTAHAVDGRQAGLLGESNSTGHLLGAPSALTDLLLPSDVANLMTASRSFDPHLGAIDVSVLNESAAILLLTKPNNKEMSFKPTVSSKGRLLCWVLTMPSTHATKAKAVLRTWGPL